MCGIVGAITERPVRHILLTGLKRLEYRGYDSAGIALIGPAQKQINTVRVLGKVNQLEQALAGIVKPSNLGIAHTRWATHGIPAEHNAHPHASFDELSIVHNGIIENHQVLRQELERSGYHFSSETDSEVIVHLIHLYQQQHDLLTAVKKATDKLQGAYAIACISKEDPNTLYVARHGSPLVIGLGLMENFIASDPIALLPVTTKFIFLEDGDLAKISKDQVAVYNHALERIERDVHHSQMTVDEVDKGSHKHFMHKEIHEQPRAILDTINHLLLNNSINTHAFGHRAADIFPQVKRLHLIACGTSLHAALVAAHWIEHYAKIPCTTAIASEHRYRDTVVEENTLCVALSQSGETADTLAALREAKNKGYFASLGITNVAESSLTREADCTFLTRAGMEIGVAATKTFTAQLVALLGLSIVLSQKQGQAQTVVDDLIQQLQSIPKYLEHALDLEDQLITVASRLVEKQHALFLGRGAHYAIAMEGALKLKEISYCHAESFAAGELKHGPLALVDEHMPVIVVAPDNHLFEKLASNIKEVQARGGELVVFTDGDISALGPKAIVIKLPKLSEAISPIIFNIPLQLLAYHVAVLKGTDVDQPRNLAKSVTVE